MPEINFYWDPLSDNILQERDETGAVTAEYTAEPGLYGNIISQNRGGVESQFHYDAQGSTLAVTDDNQNVTDTFGYTAFGEVTERTGTTEVPFQFIGQKGYYTDSMTGQIVVRRRQYEPARARWLSVDPWSRVHGEVFGDPLDGRNLYRYVESNPVMLTDPSGLHSELCSTSYCSKDFPARTPEGSMNFSVTVFAERGRPCAEGYVEMLIRDNKSVYASDGTVTCGEPATTELDKHLRGRTDVEFGWWDIANARFTLPGCTVRKRITKDVNGCYDISARIECPLECGEGRIGESCVLKSSSFVMALYNPETARFPWPYLALYQAVVDIPAECCNVIVCRNLSASWTWAMGDPSERGRLEVAEPFTQNNCRLSDFPRVRN